jgi:hypothetical protein
MPPVALVKQDPEQEHTSPTPQTSTVTWNKLSRAPPTLFTEVSRNDSKCRSPSHHTSRHTYKHQPSITFCTPPTPDLVSHRNGYIITSPPHPPTHPPAKWDTLWLMGQTLAKISQPPCGLVLEQGSLSGHRASPGVGQKRSLKKWSGGR